MSQYALAVARQTHAAPTPYTREQVGAIARTLIETHDLLVSELPSWMAVALTGQS